MHEIGIVIFLLITTTKKRYQKLFAFVGNLLKFPHTKKFECQFDLEIVICVTYILIPNQLKNIPKQQQLKEKFQHSWSDLFNDVNRNNK